MAVATSLAKQPLCQSILLGDSQSSSQILEQVGKVVASTCAGVRVEFDTFDATNESEVASFFSRATEKLGGHSEVLVNVTSYIDTSLDAASFNATPIPNFDKSYELNQKSVSPTFRSSENLICPSHKITYTFTIYDRHFSSNVASSATYSEPLFQKIRLEATMAVIAVIRTVVEALFISSPMPASTA